MTIDRRFLLKGALAAGSGLAWLSFVGVSHAQEDGGTVTFAAATPLGVLDPHVYTGLFGALDLVYEPLIKYGSQGEFLPGLAESWEVEDGGKKLRFFLRKNVTFQDGAPWDANAMKWNLERWITVPDNGWMNIGRLYESLEIVDDHQVLLSFKEPPLGMLFEFSYVRPVRFLSPTSVGPDGKFAKAVGTGPWIQTQASEASSSFERFDGYWGDAPAFRHLEVKVLPDPRSRMAALRAGEIDVIGGNFFAAVSANEAETLRGAGVNVAVEPGSTTLVMAFNSQRHPALADARVREALSIGFDRTALADILYYGFAEPTGNLLAPSIPFSGRRVPAPARDVARAAALLEEAGWTGSPVRTKDGTSLALEFVISEEQIAGSKAMAEVIQAQLGEIGAQIAIRFVDHASRHSDIPARKFDLAIFQTFGAPYEPYGSVVGLLLSTYENGVDGKLFIDAAELDPLVEAVMVATPETTAGTLQAVFDWLEAHHAIAPLLYPPSIWAVSDRIATFTHPATEYDTPSEGLTLKNG